eukprot:s2178_g10.t1
MILVARKLCPSHKVSWQTLTEGRLLHVRLHLGFRNYDIVGVYHWTHQSTNKSKRSAFLQTLDLLLSGLPKRNLLALIGDFNTSVHSFGGVVGTSCYTVKSAVTMGAQHTDSCDLEHLLQRHELCVLNTWNQQDGLTFCGPLSTSRIDFIICRQRQLDGEAKRVCQLADMPMIPSSGGHIPLVATLLRCWIPYKSSAADRRFTFTHRLLSRQMHFAQDPAWLQMLRHAEAHLQQISDAWTIDSSALHGSLPQSNDCKLQQLHSVLSDSFQSFLDQHDFHVAQHVQPDPLHAIVENKWHFWKQLRSLAIPALSNFFRAWHCWTRFSQLSCSQQAVARQKKTDKVTELTTKVVTVRPVA